MAQDARNVSLRRTIMAIVVMLVLALCTVAAAALTTSSERNDADAATARYRSAYRTAVDLGRSLIDQNELVLTYAITGDESLLEDFAAAADSSDASLGALRELVAGDDELLELVDEAEGELDAWRGEAEAVLELRSGDNGEEAAAELITSGSAPRIDASREAVGAVLEPLEVSIDESDADVSDAASRQDGLAAIGLLLAAIALIVTVLTLRRGLTNPLERLVDASTRLAHGDFDTPVPQEGSRELRDLAESLEQTRSRLEEATDRRAERGFLAMQEADHRRIAGQIHDDPVQVLTAVSLRLQRLISLLDDPEQLALAGWSAERISESVERLRTMVFTLHPTTLESHGLASTLRILLDGWAKAGTARSYAVVGDASRSDPAIVAILYRVARQAIANASFHGDASNITVEIEDGPSEVTMRVRDDGKGFDVERLVTRPGHMGLAESKHMSESVGGSFDVRSTISEGTVVTVTVAHLSDGSGDAELSSR